MSHLVLEVLVKLNIFRIFIMVLKRIVASHAVYLILISLYALQKGHLLLLDLIDLVLVLGLLHILEELLLLCRYLNHVVISSTVLHYVLVLWI